MGDLFLYKNYTFISLENSFENIFFEKQTTFTGVTYKTNPLHIKFKHVAQTFWSLCYFES